MSHCEIYHTISAVDMVCSLISRGHGMFFDQQWSWNGHISSGHGTYGHRSALNMVCSLVMVWSYISSGDGMVIDQQQCFTVTHSSPPSSIFKSSTLEAL